MREASNLIKELLSRGKTPVVTGGTGLYIKALVHGLAPLPASDKELRKELKNELESFGIDRIYSALKELDPESAEKNRSNPQRLLRALEIYKLTGEPLSALHARTAKPEWKFAQFDPVGEEELYSNINKRSKTMLSGGMVEETKKLLSMGFPKDCPGLGSLGYRHVLELISGRITLEEAEKMLAIDTRHYAKRQMTWFRGEAELNWIKVNSVSFDPSVVAVK